MVLISKDLFRDSIAAIEDEVSACSFIAVKTLISGPIPSADCEFNGLLQNAKQFAPLVFAFGLFFNESEEDLKEGNWRCKAYTVYLFPKGNLGMIDRNSFGSDRVNFDDQTVENLMEKWNFNFNQWIDLSLSYINQAERSSILRQHQMELENISDRMSTFSGDLADESRIFLKSFRRSVQDWINGKWSIGDYIIDDDSDFRIQIRSRDSIAVIAKSAIQRAIVYKSIENEFPSLFVDISIQENFLVKPESIPRKVLIIKNNSIFHEKKTSRASKKEKELHKNISESSQFNVLLDHLFESKKPIVGVGLILQFMHLFHRCIDHLSESPIEFVEKFSSTFPDIRVFELGVLNSEDRDNQDTSSVIKMDDHSTESIDYCDTSLSKAVLKLGEEFIKSDSAVSPFTNLVKLHAERGSNSVDLRSMEHLEEGPVAKRRRKDS